MLQPEIFLPKFLKIILLMLFISIAYNLKSLFKPLKSLKKKTTLILIIILIFAIIIRIFLVPHQHSIYYDEFDHINGAQNINQYNKYFLCYFYENEKCHFFQMDATPPGYHTILSLFFYIFPDTEQTAFMVNIIFSTLTIFLIFYLVLLWTNNQITAIITTFLFSLIPTHLKFSTTNILGIISLFFITLTVIFYILYKKNKKKELFIIFLISLTYTTYIRPENLFITIIFAIDLIRKKIIKKNLTLILPFIFTIIPSILLLFYGSFFLKLPGWNENIFEIIKNFMNNLITNIFFFFNPTLFPIPLTILSIFGTMKKSKEKKLNLTFFLFFFVLYSIYHIGEFNNGGTRYSLILLLPIIYFTSIIIKQIIKHEKSKLFITMLIIIFIISIIPTTNYITKESSLKTYKLDLLRTNISNDSYILSYNPSLIITTINHNTLRPEIFLKNQEYFKNKKIYLLKEYFWKKNFNSKTQKEITNNYILKKLNNSSIYKLVKITKN